MRAVIVGNSATAVGAIEALRALDQSAEVMVVSEESHLIYSRPLLSHYLGGEIDQTRLAYRPSDFYTRHEVTPILETRAVGIDTANHRLLTQDGSSIAYDRLLVCTGGTPIVPPTPGIDTEGVFSFTRRSDVESILAFLEAHGGKEAVVVGGGMIGIKATDALIKRGIRVTMVELAPRILGAALDSTASRLMTSLLEEAGVRVLTRNTVTEIQSREGRVHSVTLRDGGPIRCDLMIFGIGVRPNTALVEGSDIRVNRGIVVDEFMRTSAPDVYAAGDVAEAYDLVVDMNRTVAIWPNAYRQGAIAGAHMVGIETPDAGGVAMNAIEVHGVPAISIGNSNLEDDPTHEFLTDLDERNHRYKRLVLKDDRLVGATLVGRINRAGIYTGLIRHKIDVGGSRSALMSEQFGLLSLPDRYRKHVVTGEGIEV
jgi:NAD(P)H-nitrite reductase large subunit